MPSTSDALLLLEKLKEKELVLLQAMTLGGWTSHVAVWVVGCGLSGSDAKPVRALQQVHI